VVRENVAVQQTDPGGAKRQSGSAGRNRPAVHRTSSTCKRKSKRCALSSARSFSRAVGERWVSGKPGEAVPHDLRQPRVLRGQLGPPSTVALGQGQVVGGHRRDRGARGNLGAEQVHFAEVWLAHLAGPAGPHLGHAGGVVQQVRKPVGDHAMHRQAHLVPLDAAARVAIEKQQQLAASPGGGPGSGRSRPDGGPG